MTEIQAGLRINANVQGAEQIKTLADEIQAAGLDTGKLAEEAAKLHETFAKTSHQQALIEKYKALSGELEETGRAMKAADTLLDGLHESMKDGATAEQKEAVAKLRAEMEKLAKKETELAEKVRDSRNAMAASGVSVKHLAEEERRLALESDVAAFKLDKLAKETAELKALADAKMTLGIDTDEKAHAELKRIKEAYETLKRSGTLSQQELARAAELHNDKVYTLEKSLRSLRPTISDVVSEFQGVASAAAGLTYAAREAIKFESAMAGVKKVVDGTPEEIAALESKIKDLSVQFGIMPDQMAEIAAAGGQLGIAMEKLPEFAEVTATMAAAFGMTAEEAGNAAATIANVFQLPIAEVSRLGDAINVLGNNTAAKEKDIISAMARIGGSAKQFGLAAEEAAALADAFIALGKPPEVAATAINALLGKLQTAQAQGKDFKAALESIGISAGQMAANIAANPQRALSDFLSKLQQLDKQSRALVLSDLFGTEYSDDIALLVGSLGEYEKALGLVADKSRTMGAMSKEAAAAMETAEKQIDSAKSALANMAAEIGSTLLPVISAAASTTATLASAVGSVADRFPILTQLAVLYASAQVAVKAFAAVSRLGGAAAIAGLVSHKKSVDAVAASYGKASAAADVFGVKSSAAAALSVSRWSAFTGVLGKLAVSFPLIGVASDVLIDINNHLYKTSSMARTVMDGIARVPAMIHSLWDTGSLEQYRKHFKTYEESQKSVAETVGELIEKKRQDEEAEKKRLAAAQATSLAFSRLKQEYQAVTGAMDTLRYSGMETGEVYKEMAARAEKLRVKLDEVGKQAGYTKEQIAEIAAEKGVTEQMAAAFAKLGVDIGEVNNGIGADAREAFKNFQTASDAAAKHGADNANLIRAAFEQMMGKLQSRAEFEAFRAQLQKSGDAAALTKEQLNRLNTAAKEGAAGAKTAYDAMAQSVKAAADTADLTRAAAEAKAAFEAGTITAAQYDQILAQVKQRTAELEAQTAKAGDTAANAHNKAAAAARNHEAAATGAANANKQMAESTNMVGNAASGSVRKVTALHQGILDGYGVVKLTREEFTRYMQVLNSYRPAGSWFLGGNWRAAKNEYLKAIKDAQEAHGELNDAISNGTVNMSHLIRATTAAGMAAGKLDNASLANLRNSIEAARQKLVQLKDEATDARLSIEAELAAINGDEEAGFALQQQRKLAELRAKQQQAAKYGQSDAAGEWARALQAQETLYARQKEERQRQKAEEEQRRREADAGGKNSGRVNLGDLSGLKLDGLQGTADNVIRQFQTALEARDSKVIEKAGGALLQQLSDGIKRMS